MFIRSGMHAAKVLMPGQNKGFVGWWEVSLQATSGYHSCERNVSLGSNVQGVSNSLGLSAAAFVSVCEGLAVILATCPIELPCLTSLESRRWPCQGSEITGFFIHALANVLLCNYRKHQRLWSVIQVDGLWLRAAKPLECELNLDSDQLEVDFA